MEFLLDDDNKSILSDIGLLIIRIWAGLTMFFAHGIAKLTDYSQYAENFDGMFGLPGGLNAALVAFAEGICALLVAAGILTRLTAIPLVFAMAGAAYAHMGLWGDPFSDAELALTFGAVFLMLVFTGPGKFSVDTVIDRVAKSD